MFSVTIRFMTRHVEIRLSAWVFALLVIAMSLVGTLGYVYLENWTFLDAFYMTAITITTVGFSEVRDLSPAGRLFTIFLMAFGVGTVAYGFSIISQYIFEVSLSRLAVERRMLREIAKVKDHYIVCGYGRVGRNATEMVRQDGYPVVVLDTEEERLQKIVEARNKDVFYLVGDATDDNILMSAGVQRARGLLVCTGDDANNLFIVLSARALNPSLMIVARASRSINEPKMLRAGANKVISPYRIGGQRMANFATRPDLSEMLDVVTTGSGLELWLEDLRIGSQSPLVGLSLREAEIRQRTGVTIVVLNRSGQNVMSPGADTRMQAGDHLVVIGTREQLAGLDSLANGSEVTRH